MRRSKEDSLVTRKIILNAALKIFHTNGFKATSISDICEEAGVTKGALYWHFESKDELFLKMLRENLDEIGSVVSYYRDQPIPPDEKLQKIYTSMFELIQNNKNFHMALEIVVTKAEIQGAKIAPEDTRKKEVMLNFTTIFQEGIDSGLFKDDMTASQYNFYFKSVLTGIVWGSIELPELISLKEWGPKFLEVTMNNVLLKNGGVK